jgi:hypothetical protein
MTTQPTIDQAKTEAFLGKVLSDTSGMTGCASNIETFQQACPTSMT